ncbi:MAG: hypothetical protein J3K34DRAFT_426698 [Monoraphidium minutum]|nr:MAG: hypothetical protein J3K34DRAFT_426698 [Monoraphidium minutum]
MAGQSAEIASRVLASRAFCGAQAVGVYIHCDRLREVDTSALLAAAVKAGKRVYVPLVDDRDSNMRLLHIERVEELKAAPPYGILEPPPAYPDGGPRENVLEMPRPLDLLLMPGLGFDDRGGRLGRGGGCARRAAGGGLHGLEGGGVRHARRCGAAALLGGGGVSGGAPAARPAPQNRPNENRP